MGRVSRKLFAWLVLVTLLISIGYASTFAVGGTKDTNELYDYSTAVGGTFEYAVILALVLWIAGSRQELLALRRPRSWPSSLGLAGVVLLASFVVIEFLLDPFITVFNDKVTAKVEGIVLPPGAGAAVIGISGTDTIYAVPFYNGRYEFRNVPAGTWSFDFKGTNGFQDTTIANIQVDSMKTVKLPTITLHP